MKTNVALPYCLIKFGRNVGYKLAFLEQAKAINGNIIEYIGYPCNRHYSKICKDQNFSTYKTKRKFQPIDLLDCWRNIPTLQQIERCIKRDKSN